MKRLLTLIVVLAAGAAFADISPDVKKYLGSAAALFEKLEYEKALAQLKRAKAKSQGPEDDLKIALYEGVVLAEMGDAGAPAAFTSALGMDPTATLPLVVSPKVQKVFDKSKAQVQKVLDAQAEVDRKKEEEAKKAEEAKKPAPAPEPVAVVEAPKPPPPPPPSSKLRLLAVVPAVIGLGGLGAGTGLMVVSNSAHNALVSGNIDTGDQARGVAQQGALFQNIGVVAIAVGVAALVAAIAMFAFGG